jgi:hypothetical protein
MLLTDPSVRVADCLIAESHQSPAVTMLKGCPVPVIAVMDDGAVLFASTVFEYLLGYSCDAGTSVSYGDICAVLPADETLFAVTRLVPSVNARPMQSGQATVFVKMCKSAMRSGADWDAVMMLEQLMERLSPEAMVEQFKTEGLLRTDAAKTLAD